MWIVLKSVPYSTEGNANVTVTKTTKMAGNCQIFKKVCSEFNLWVWKGVDFLDEFVINNSKDNF